MCDCYLFPSLAAEVFTKTFLQLLTIGTAVIVRFFLWQLIVCFSHHGIVNENEKGHENENSVKPLGCTSQWTSYIVWIQAVSAYEKYITFAFIEFKRAELCFVKILPW